MSTINFAKPDILIPFKPDINEFIPVAVIYVRPETNNLHYEKAIITGVRNYSEVLYMANLNGKLFVEDGLIQRHYPSQFQFALYGKREICKYPEMVKEFEERFGIGMDEARILGSFEAIEKLNISEEKLFHTFVNEAEFLNMYGQSIKKIGDCYVLNYDMPALIRRNNTGTNVFVMTIRLKDREKNFQDINYAIFEQIKANEKTPLIDDEMYGDIEWFKKIRRSYHISRNHIMAMFDMVDFVFRDIDEHIEFNDTPLGHHLIQRNYSNEKNLERMKLNPLVYLKTDKGPKLINIIEEAMDKNFEECVELVNNCNYSL